MLWQREIILAAGLIAAFLLGRWSSIEKPNTVLVDGSAVRADEPAPVPIKGWTKGKGWGWVWGKNDEVGALNALTPQSIKAALSLARSGQVYDLGVAYDRQSYRWPGHNPTEVMLFRGPEGLKRQGDLAFINDPKSNPARVGWHSCALFINDNVGTQIDGLGHLTTGDDNHWYNGFKEADWGGNFGVRKCDAATIPPVIARGVMIDVAAFRKVDALPAHYRISAEDLKNALARQKTVLRPGDVVLIRTGVLKHWGSNGGEIEKIKSHDSAGIDLTAARWLVEENGAILIGADNSGLERTPTAAERGEFLPVHRYLLVEQGVHIGELHYLEDLARDQVYEFCYVGVTNKIRGTTAGFCLRPLALR